MIIRHHLSKFAELVLNDRKICPLKICRKCSVNQIIVFCESDHCLKMTVSVKTVLRSTPPAVW